MVDPISARLKIVQALEDNGQFVQIQHYTETLSGSYDNFSSLATSGGVVWCNGMSQPLGTQEEKLLEQGRIRIDDRRLYLPGSVVIDTEKHVRIGLGSPTPDNEYRMLPEGREEWNVNGSIVFNKVLIRDLNAGSFV